MRRRSFVFGMASAAALGADAVGALAQQRERPRRVAALLNLTSSDPEAQARLAAFLQGMQEEGWRVGERPVTAQLVEALLSPQLDDLEPRLRRHGYDVPDLAELINARQGEIRSLLRGELEPVRSQELTAKLLAAGLPV